MITILDPDLNNQAFPPIERALTEPDGLLAAGGCLSSQRLMNAYYHGIFPWYNEDDPILWWSPDPRLVLFPDKIHISKSLKKALRQQPFTIRFNTDFAAVIHACSQPRDYEKNTWLNEEMQQAYIQLHQQGHAHSIEAWHQGNLVGGLYGVTIGKIFFGESMFHTQTNASKAAFITLAQQLKEWRYEVIDCQIHSNHLVSLGAEEISRQQFSRLLNRYRQSSPRRDAWT